MKHLNVGKCKQGDVVVFQTTTGHGTIIPDADGIVSVPSNTIYATVNGVVKINTELGLYTREDSDIKDYSLLSWCFGLALYVSPVLIIFGMLWFIGK